ncbi:hypothetical protein CANARDRAFT_27781, partial [[Candida] arabinofermentans NRRL YB-2248]
MAGRIHGFLGGVLLTGSIAYLTAVQLTTRQQIISHHLNESSRVIEERDIPTLHRSNVISYENKTVSESVKDIWNHEVIKGTNWLYSLNFSKIGDYVACGVEKLVGSSKN